MGKLAGSRVDYDYAIGNEDGTWSYMTLVEVGGRDENGEYLLVLDGPAQGEKVYV